MNDKEEKLLIKLNEMLDLHWKAFDIQNDCDDLLLQITNDAKGTYDITSELLNWDIKKLSKIDLEILLRTLNVREMAEQHKK